MRAGWVSSVLTGNIAANAHVKLAAFGLDALLDLPVGAYGADAEQRPQLVDIARRRMRTDRGLPPHTPVVLVGDTPRDVEAALTSSAHVIAVATGIDPRPPSPRRRPRRPPRPDGHRPRPPPAGGRRAGLKRTAPHRIGTTRRRRFPRGTSAAPSPELGEGAADLRRHTVEPRRFELLTSALQILPGRVRELGG